MRWRYASSFDLRVLLANDCLLPYIWTLWGHWIDGSVSKIFFLCIVHSCSSLGWLVKSQERIGSNSFGSVSCLNKLVN
jgi:hypothetical protein